MLATARNDPRYVFLWLATAYLGAIYAAVDPRQTETELRGLIGQVGPKLVVTDENVDELFAAPGELDGPGPAEHDDPAVLIPTSGTTGRSKLVTQTHRAYAHGRRGLPVVARAERGRPADDVAPALPHQRARILGAGLGRGARERGAPPALLGQRVPRLGPAPRGDRVQRDRRDARDPDAPARAAGRRRQPAADRLRGADAAGGAPPRVRAPLRRRAEVRLRHVGDALRHRLGARDAARTARSARRASTPARPGERGARERRRRARAAQPRRDEGLLGHAGRDRGRCSRPTGGSGPATW